MKHFKLIALFVLFFALLFNACKKEDTKITKAIKGVAQKGPFLIGSDVTIFELNENLEQTGRVFTTTTTDNFGSFELPETEFESQYLEIKIDGKYYDEILEYYWSERVILKSIVKIRDNSFNINLLTHIANERLKYLVQTKNLTFDLAREQSRQEVLNIFSLADTDVDFNSLDISGSVSDDAKLTAISALYSRALLVVYYTNEDHSFLLPTIIEDIKTDGTLDDPEIQKLFAKSAVFMLFHDVRKNLSDYYGENKFNNFHTYIKEFIENTEYEKPIVPEYSFPDQTEYGINLLNLSHLDTINPANTYCFAVNWDGIRYLDLSFTKSKDQYNYSFTTNFGEPPNNQYDWHSWHFYHGDDYTRVAIDKTTGAWYEANIPLIFSFEGHGEGGVELQIFFENGEEFITSKTIIW